MLFSSIKNINSVIFDSRANKLIYYENGKKIHTYDINAQSDVVNFCMRNFCDRNLSIFLIGSTSQLSEIIKELDKYGYGCNVCSYDIEQVSHNQSTYTLNEVLSSLNEIKDMLKRGLSKSANLSIIESSLPQQEELKSYIKDSYNILIQKQSEMNYLVSEIYNRNQESSNNMNSEVLADLRKELAEYKSDFYQKSMLKFGVNTAVEILERLYTEKNLLKQKENAAEEELDRITQIISFCEIKMKKLNLRVGFSTDGDEFDGERMVSFDDKVATDDENLKGRVAYSISPAIYWSLPRVNAPGEDNLLIKEETVALYE